MTGYSELKRLAEETRVSPINSVQRDRDIVHFQRAASPAAVLALIAEVESLKSDSLCPACEGSGEGWVLSDNGPDAHNIQVDCPECFGPGTMLGAYQAMKIQRDSQIERTVNAGGDLLFMRVERDQLKAEVEALRKDAERYRFLRQDISNNVQDFCIVKKRWSATFPDRILELDGADAEIDAAMGKGAKP